MKNIEFNLSIFDFKECEHYITENEWIFKRVGTQLLFQDGRNRRPDKKDEWTSCNFAIYSYRFKKLDNISR